VGGDAAAQMAFDVLQVLRLGAVDVAREVEVEVVLRVADLRHRHHARVARDFGLAREDVHDLVDVLGAQAVLRAVLDEALGGVDHEDALAGGCVFLVEHDDAGGDARAIEEIRGQPDDGLDVAALHEVLADDGLGIAAEEDTVRENARAFAAGLERADDVQQVGVVALLGGRHAVVREALEGVVGRVEAGAPAFVAERRISDDVVEGLELTGGVGEERAGQRVALLDERRGVVVQDHVHPGEAGGGGVLFLPVERDLDVFAVARLVADLQQQRTGAAGGVVDGRVVARLGVADAEELRHDAADLGRSIELPFALAALGGEVPHQVFVGIAEDVVAVGAVLREVERRVLEDGDEVGKTVHHLLAAAEPGGVVEVRHVGQLVGIGQRPEDLLVDLVADVALALECDHVGKAGAPRNRDRGERHADVFVADVFHEQQNEDVVLVLAGIHAAAQLITAGPEGGVEFGFFQGHFLFSILTFSFYGCIWSLRANTPHKRPVHRGRSTLCTGPCSFGSEASWLLCCSAHGGQELSCEDFRYLPKHGGVMIVQAHSVCTLLLWMDIVPIVS